MRSSDGFARVGWGGGGHHLPRSDNLKTIIHRRQFDFGYTKVHSERSGDGHSPPGVEACSPGNFFYFYVLRDQFWCILAAQTVHILPVICLVLKSTGIQG